MSYYNKYNGYTSRANSWYKSYSMSYNASIAYNNGYKPKSKWTKKLMIEAINDYLWDTENSKNIIENIKKMKKNDIFIYLFEYKECHHCGKFYNLVDFYGINEDAIDEMIEGLQNG